MTMPEGKGLNATVLRDRLHDLATREGIQQWDLGAACSDDCSVQVDRGEAKQLKAAQRSSITVRVWNSDGLVGITSTTDLSEAGLEQALMGAHAASRYGNPEDVPHFSPMATAPLPSIDRPLKPRQGILPLLDTLRDAEADLLGRHVAIQTVPYNGLAESLAQSLYLNSEGALREMERTQASLYLCARAEETGRKPRTGGAVRLALGSSDLDIEGCVNEATDKTISHLNYGPIDTGTYRVCFTPEAFLSLLGAFSSMFNARAVIDGLSLSQRDSIGTQLAVPFLSLHDDGLHSGHISAAPFDGEGTPTQNLCVIRGGELQNFLHSEATARAFSVKPTGHAGLGAKVSVGPDWLVVSSTEGRESGENLDHRTENDPFVLIEDLSALHAGVKATQGSFSLPFDGWLVRGKERVSVEAATVAGDIRTLLQTILHLETEQHLTHRGVSPHVWVDHLSITGEA